MDPLVTAAALTGSYVLGLYGWTMMRNPARIEPAPRADRQRTAAPPGQRLAGKLVQRLSERLAPRATRLLGPSRLERIRRRLDAAGRPGGMTIEGYAGRKATFTLLFGGVGLLFLLSGDVALFLVCGAAGWMWVDVWLARAARVRKEQIERELPDFLDILAVTVSAGVGFRPALARVADALGGPLGTEVLTALRQMELGATRRDAFEALRRRNESPSLSQFVTALLQAEELGVPLSDALVSLAADMRRSFYQDARRRAAKAAPRVSLIISLVIVPGALMLIVGAMLMGSNADVGGFL